MKYKIIVAHPGKQHSFRLASALKKSGLLFKYVTTVYNKETSLIMKMIKFFVNKENGKRIDSRKNNDLKDGDVIQYGELRGIIEVFLARYDKSKKIYYWWNRKNSYFFGRKVAELAIKENVDAVIMYDTNAKICFEILEKKAPNIIRIMDVSAANRIYMKEIYEKDMKKFPKFAEQLKKECFFLWKKKEYEYFKSEIEKTQFFLVPSKFVKKSLEYSGIGENQILMCPYGSNFSPLSEKKYNTEDKVKAIYVGNITAIKGIQYLLEAILEMPKDKIELTVVGNFDNSTHLFDKYLERVCFTGRVLHEEVRELLSNSDIFIFPSLGEGLSLAVLEAMACGLPCIVSKNSGANDAIINGVNGFIVDIQNKDILKEKMWWFIENKKLIPKMGREAIKSIYKYNWDNYEKNITEIMKNFILKNNYKSKNIM